jgi:hypothetical protein
MSDIQSIVNSLLSRASKVDPVMLSILQEILNEIDRLGIKIDKPPIVAAKISIAARIKAPDSPIDFTYTLTQDNVFLNWTAPSSNFIYYELRKGTIWSSATKILITANNQVVLDPLPVGSHTYLLRSLDTEGNYSEDTASVVVTIPVIGPVTIILTQINTNVLLRWSTPISTFRIDHYVLSKSGGVAGTISGTFFTFFETTGGTFIYSVTPYDIAGNAGPTSSITVTVPSPDNFIFKSGFTSNLSGIKVNAVLEPNANPPRLLLPINTTETYQAHFTSRGWNSPQDQINAGYPRWLSPGPTPATASYKEVFDCGTIYTNTIITHAYSSTILSGAFTIGISTRVSNDNITWSAPFIGTSFFTTSLRYIEVTINFTGSNDKALLEFYNLIVSVAVKEEVDSGSINALATDAAGTVVTFNKPFKDVDSITASVASTKEPYTVIRNFVDIPNPINFTVFVYDTSGIRVSQTVDWKARGII